MALIRPAEDKDAAEIAAVLNWAIRETEITFRSRPRSIAEVAAEVAAKRVKGWPYLVGSIEGRIVGFATYGQFRAGEGYLHTMEHSIVLLPEAQGKGLGRSLMDALAAHGRAHGVHSLMAGVSGANPEGVAFHAALGFVEVGILPAVGFKNGRWFDLVLMQLLL